MQYKRFGDDPRKQQTVNNNYLSDRRLYNAYYQFDDDRMPSYPGYIQHRETCAPFKEFVSGWKDLLFLETTLPTALICLFGGSFVVWRMLVSDRRKTGADVYHGALALAAMLCGGFGSLVYVYDDMAKSTRCPHVPYTVCKIYHVLVWWLGTVSGAMVTLVAWDAYRRQSKTRAEYLRKETKVRAFVKVLALWFVLAVLIVPPVFYDVWSGRTNSDGGGCIEDFFQTEFLRDFVGTLCCPIPVVLGVAASLCYLCVRKPFSKLKIGNSKRRLSRAARSPAAMKRQVSKTEGESSSKKKTRKQTDGGTDNIEQQSSDESIVVADTPSSDGSSSSLDDEELSRRSFEASRPVSCIATAFIICWTPWLAVYLIFSSCVWGSDDDDPLVKMTNCMTTQLDEAFRWTNVIWFAFQAVVVLALLIGRNDIWQVAKKWAGVCCCVCACLAATSE